MSRLASLLANLLVLGLLPLVLLVRRLTKPRARWLELRVRSEVVEIVSPAPWYVRFLPNARMPTALHTLRELAAVVAKDAHVEGVVIFVPPLRSGWSSAEGLRDVIARLRTAGKKTVVYLPRGGSHKELFVALAADRVVLPKTVTLFAPGLSAERVYLADVLARLGIRFERFRRAKYKSAYETFERNAMSEGEREQTTALLGAFDGALREAIARKIGERVDEVFKGAILDGDEVKALGLADETAYEDELPRVLGLAKKESTLAAGRYYAARTKPLFRRILRRPYIAVVPIRGVIVDEGMPGRDLDAVRGALRRVESDAYARAVVLYVDSPGGSAVASDLIHREITALTKPVVAYFGEVAASGGYYVAAPAKEIIARALSITGSIGVISARPDFEGAIERIGAHVETIRTAPHADFLSPTRALTDDERAIFERHIERFYRTFLGIVAKGRGLDEAAVEPLAGGRVWSGLDAQRVGLVDHIGGLDLALARVQALLPEAERKRVLEPVVIKLLSTAPPAPKRAAEALAFFVETLLGVEKAHLLSALVRPGREVHYLDTEVPEIR